MKLYIFVSVFIIYSTILFSQDGSLDLSFDSDGLVNTDINSDSDQGQDVAIQSDGKIIIVGYSYDGTNNNFSIVRYNTDGTLDNTFGTSGKTSVAIGSSAEAFTVEVQSDDKIVVGGFAWTGSSNDFAVCRLMPDGAIDNTFGSSGITTTGFGGDDHFGRSLAIQPDGKILLGGFVEGSVFPGGGDFGIVRYNSDGTLDTSFDSDGKVTVDFSGGYDSGKDIAVDSNGKIIIVGGSDNPTGDFAVARYNTDGTLDTTFDSDGKATTDFGISYQYAYSLAIQSDGKIIAAGTADGSNSSFVISRYNSDGSLDISFDTDGKVITSFGTNDGNGKSVAVQADGKIIFGGYSFTGSNDDFTVVRYNSTISSMPISVAITALLEGPYNGTNMNSTITVPTTSPFTEDLESLGSIPSIPSNEVVDWVLVQLRDKTDESIVLESQSAFILQDGSIVDLDGSSPVQFTQPADNYFISVKHRNHLSVMSNVPVVLN